MGGVLHVSPHPPERADHGVEAAPVPAGPVHSWAHEVLPSSIVGMLVEGPVALHDVAGVDVSVMEALVHVGAVIHELHHVPHHLGPVVKPHLVGSSILQVKDIRV